MGAHKNNMFSINSPLLTRTLFHIWDPQLYNSVIVLGLKISRCNNLFLTRSTECLGSHPLANLKQLELTCYHANVLGCSDLVWASVFQMSTPLLQKLTLRRVTAPHGYSANDTEIFWEPLEFTHSRLKEVEIARCVGNWYETEFAIFKLLNVHGLEQIVFNSSRRYYVGGREWSEGKGILDLDAHSYWQESGREIVRKKIEDRVPASTKLVSL